MAFSAAIFLYFFLLILIYCQNRWLLHAIPCNKERLLILANLELIIFFICFYFIFGTQRIFGIWNLLFSGTLSIVFSLLLYFGGLFAFHYFYKRQVKNKQSSLFSAWREICFLVPFVVPFLIYVLFMDFLAFIPLDNVRRIIGIEENTPIETFVILVLNIAFMLAMIILLPRLIIVAWQCRKLHDSPLKERLEQLCLKADFKHAGLKVWTVMQDSLTAAIIGVISRFRYVMFTQKLLNRLSPDAIEAILAHEIGHSRRKHLFFYPFIFFGMIVCGGIFSSILYDLLMQSLVFRHFISSFPLRNLVESFIFYLFFLMIIVVYFRVVFGYFSRIFERQADLHVFELELPPVNMIEALNEIGVASGFTHDDPSWHHYSIRQRIDFLKKAQADPTVVKSHHRKVCYSLIAYFVFLGAVFGTLFVFFL